MLRVKNLTDEKDPNLTSGVLRFSIPESQMEQKGTENRNGPGKKWTWFRKLIFCSGAAKRTLFRLNGSDRSFVLHHFSFHFCPRLKLSTST